MLINQDYNFSINYVLLEEIFDKDDVTSVWCCDVAEIDVAVLFHVIDDGVIAFFYMFPLDGDDLFNRRHQSILTIQNKIQI